MKNRDVWKTCRDLVREYDMEIPEINKVSIVERLLATKIFKLGYIPSAQRFSPGDLQIRWNHADENKIVFTSSSYYAYQLYPFLKTNCDSEATLLEQDDEKVVRVSATAFKERLIPLIRSILAEVSKINPGALEDDIYVGKQSCCFKRKKFMTSNLMFDKDNFYGTMMREIDDNLKKIFISIYQSRIFLETFVTAITRSADLNKYLFFWSNSVVDLIYPGENGNTINLVLPTRNGNATHIALGDALLELGISATVINSRGAGNEYETVTMWTKDFYEKVLPLMKEEISKVANAVLPTRYNGYVFDSNKDPEIELAKEKSSVPNTQWHTDRYLVFPSASQPTEPKATLQVEETPALTEEKTNAVTPKPAHQHHGLFSKVKELVHHVPHKCEHKPGF